MSHRPAAHGSAEQPTPAPRPGPATGTALPGRGRRLLRGCMGRLALVSLSAAVCLVLLEIAVRLVLPQQLIELRPDVWIPHDGLGWARAGDLDTVINTGERDVRLATDARGHRIPPGGRSGPEEPELSVLALGDSFLAALQVGWDDTLAARLERRLGERLEAPVEVTNTGVAGYGPSHYRLVAAEELRTGDHDLVLAVVFLGNDVESFRRDHFPPKEPTPRRYFRWPESLAPLELRNALAYPLNDVLERRSHLFVLVRHRVQFLLMGLGLTPRSLPEVLQPSQADAPRWEIAADLLAATRALADEREIPFLAVLLPGEYQVTAEMGARYARAAGVDPSEIDPDQPSRRMLEELRERAVPVVDVTPALRRAAAEGVEPYGRVDSHLAPAGHRIVAETIEPLVAEMLRRGKPPAATGERR